MAFEELIVPVLFGSIIAIVPFLLFAIFKVRVGKKAFLFGILGWLLALILRIVPVQIPTFYINPQDITAVLLYFVFASLMAGILDEVIRFWLLRSRKFLKDSRKSVLSFGLGWGIGEAVILYIPAIVSFMFMSETVPTLLDMLPGAIERNFAIIAHLGLTLIILKAVESGKSWKKYLILAVALHFLLNVVATFTLTLSQGIWLTEGVTAISALVILLIGRRLDRKPKAAT